MADADPSKVIRALAVKLANREIENTLLEVQLEDARAVIAAQGLELSKTRTGDTVLGSDG